VWVVWAARGWTAAVELPRDHDRSVRIARAAYLRSPNERPLWIHTAEGNRYDTLGAHRTELAHLLR